MIDAWLSSIFSFSVSRAKSAPEFFADRLYDALKGAGTDDERLIRCVVTRAEVETANQAVRLVRALQEKSNPDK